jgi:hypothetical protein
MVHRSSLFQRPLLYHIHDTLTNANGICSGCELFAGCLVAGLQFRENQCEQSVGLVGGGELFHLECKKGITAQRLQIFQLFFMQ